jgi:hypothetical protein
MVRKIRGLFSSAGDQQEQPFVQANAHLLGTRDIFRRSANDQGRSLAQWDRRMTAYLLLYTVQ